jgi:hypothetical protein
MIVTEYVAEAVGVLASPSHFGVPLFQLMWILLTHT